MIKLKKIITIVTLILILFFANISYNFQLSSGNTVQLTSQEYLTEKLVNEVQLYIKKIAKTSKVDARSLVLCCQKNDMDITFVLAQAQIESHFGTKGRAVNTNSIFNVGTYDDGQIVYTYKHPNQSVEPFIRLLKSQYLVNKDIDHLLRRNGYKNVRGERFATSTTYEQRLKNVMETISETTDIDDYQDFMAYSGRQLHTNKYSKND